MIDKERIIDFGEDQDSGSIWPLIFQRSKPEDAWKPA